MSAGHTKEPWVDFKVNSASGYVYGVRSGPGLICAMPGWLMHDDLRAQQVANHKLILSAPDLLAENDRLKALNAELAAALYALIDVWDDHQNNAPEYRCYVEEAWPEVLKEAHAVLAKNKETT